MHLASNPRASFRNMADLMWRWIKLCRRRTWQPASPRSSGPICLKLLIQSILTEMKWIALFPLVQFYAQLLFRHYNWINQLNGYGSVASPKCQWWGIPCVLNDMRSHQFNRCSRLCNSFSKSSSNHTICSFSGSKLNFNCNMALNFKSRQAEIFQFWGGRQTGCKQLGDWQIFGDNQKGRTKNIFS